MANKNRPSNVLNTIAPPRLTPAQRADAFARLAMQPAADGVEYGAEYVVRILGAVRSGVASFRMVGPLTPASLLRVYLQTLQTFDNVTAAELPPHTVAAWVEGNADVAFILKATAVPHWGTVLIVGSASPARANRVASRALARVESTKEQK